MSETERERRSVAAKTHCSNVIAIFSIVNHLAHNSFRHFIRMYENNVANKLCK